MRTVNIFLADMFALLKKASAMFLVAVVLLFAALVFMVLAQDVGVTAIVLVNAGIAASVLSLRE